MQQYSLIIVGSIGEPQWKAIIGGYSTASAALHSAKMYMDTSRAIKASNSRVLLVREDDQEIIAELRLRHEVRVEFPEVVS